MAFALLAIVPTAVVGYLAYDSGKRAIEQQTMNHLVSTNLLKSSEMDRWIEDNERSLEELAQRPLVRENTAILATHNTTNPAYIEAHRSLIEEHFEPRLQKTGGFTELFIMCPIHGIIIASNDDKQEGKYRDAELYFIEGRSDTYVQGVYYSTALQEPAMTISTPIKDTQGNLIAVLAGRLDLGELSTIISLQTGMSQTEDTYLVNASNFFVTEPRFGQDYALKKAARTEGVEAALSGNDGVGYYDDYRGVPIIGAYNWLPKYNLVILTEVDVSEAFEAVALLGRTTTTIIVVTTILSVMVGWFVAKTITRPVRKLVQTTEEIGRGNLDQNVFIAGRDEISELSESFSQMAKNLQEIMVSRDELAKEVAERKEAEENLKQTMTELERSNSELERFAYVASHDLQEPLRMVSSYTQLLEKRYRDKLDADANEFINYAVGGAKRMQQLINDLLAYSRVGTRGKSFETTNCEAVLDAALANLEVAIHESSAVVTHDPLPEVEADEAQLVQLFQNLLDNAVKFHGEQPPCIHVSAAKKDDEWVFSVRDNGIGIDQQYFERVFVVFQRLHREEYRGTGIGLAIAQRIVHRHGGRIEVGWI